MPQHIPIFENRRLKEEHNFKIFTHLLPNFSYKDPRMTEVTYHCINFNEREDINILSNALRLPETIICNNVQWSLV
jgi:hypothetical protein